MNRTLLILLALAGGCSETGLSQEPVPAVPGGPFDPPPEPLDAVGLSCPTDAPAPRTVPVDASCRREPEIGGFSPRLEWNWRSNPVHGGYHQVMAQPVVGQLTDDDGDGDIDADDVPDVVFMAFTSRNYNDPGALVAISGDDGRTLWSVRTLGRHQPIASSGVAIGDIDGTGPSVFVYTTGGLARVDAEGRHVWTAALERPGGRRGHPALADLDVDGTAEVVAGATVVGADGTVRWVGEAGQGTGRHFAVPVDLDGDGPKEVVAGGTVYESDGSVRWTTGEDGATAVADLDLDGVPEVVLVLNGELVALHADGTTRWRTRRGDRGGGPPTVADYDGDGLPEIGVAGADWYEVYEADGSRRWRMPVRDYSSSRTGSSVFDFEGDGAAEVVYADETTLWVFDGSTGTVELRWTAHSSGTLWEYPMVVDVDADGAAEIVAAANDYAFPGSRGIVVIGDAADSWSAARPVWNQHAYSIDNVLDDGTIPRSPTPSWAARNTFRAGNAETALGLDLPDLVPVDAELCTDTCTYGYVEAWVAVGNQGLAAVGASPLSLYRVDGDARARVETLEVPPLAAGSVAWVGPLRIARDAFGPDGLDVVVDDAGTGPGLRDECDEDAQVLRIDVDPCE